MAIFNSYVKLPEGMFKPEAIWTLFHVFHAIHLIAACELRLTRKKLKETDTANVPVTTHLEPQT